jgi:gamma-glutamylcysteine synthetase
LQHQQELKIKSGVSKNFASQVMSKFGIKPGMSEEEINIAKIKAIMAQKQLEKEQQQQQQKQKQTSPKTSTSKGFLLIPSYSLTADWLSRKVIFWLC